MTPEAQRIAMSPKQQRIAIAEACGWKKVEIPTAAYADFNLKPEDKFWWDGCEETQLPDYLNDLNAIHEAEMTLSDAEFWPTYYDNLSTATGGEHCMGKMIRATAAQRAEAFLRTKGLWKE